jgi:hypothetical protein
MIELRWVEYRSKRGVLERLELFVGLCAESIASLTKATKWWAAWIELPGVDTARRYGPFDEQKADIENVVSAWFDLAHSMSASAQKERHLSADIADSDLQRPDQPLG